MCHEKVLAALLFVCNLYIVVHSAPTRSPEPTSSCPDYNEDECPFEPHCKRSGSPFIPGTSCPRCQTCEEYACPMKECTLKSGCLDYVTPTYVIGNLTCEACRECIKFSTQKHGLRSGSSSPKMGHDMQGRRMAVDKPYLLRDTP